MNIFQEKMVRDAMSHPNFTACLKAIHNASSLDFDELSAFPWDHYQKKLSALISASFNDFKNMQSTTTPITFIPPEGLKGIYFCLGDDGCSLVIAGSLYFNETDWAANADFDLDTDEITQTLNNLLKQLTVFSLNANQISELMYLFMAFTINKALKMVQSILEIAHAGIVVGYSDGDELILGYFAENRFIEQISVVENGHYDSPSTFKEPFRIPFKPRGAIWDYLKLNYNSFIKEQGLEDQFTQDGEQAAKSISEKFKEHIFINQCKKCGTIKKRPKANLCLGCGDFSEPAYHN